MFKTTLLHPEILRPCARAGHRVKIPVADGNYPASTGRGPNAELVCLQLTPGVPTVAQVLRAILSAVPIDAVNTMGIPDDDPYAKCGEPPAGQEFRTLATAAGITAPIAPISKWDFYRAVESPGHVLTIQTAGQALWTNLLLAAACRNV